MRFLKRFWWILAIGFLAGGFVMWRINTAQAEELKKNTFTVKRQDLEETLALSGEIDAKEKADVKFQTSGLLTWVGVKEGDVVKKYQAIAALDKRELQNTMNQYLNSYMKERWDFEQDIDNNKDWETRGMTDLARDTVKRTLQKNQFDLNNAVLAVEAKNLSLKFATIFAPFEGIVTKVDVPVPGTNVTPASAVFTIVNPKTLYFSASADQTEVINFSAGKSGTIILESFPDIELPATVESVSFVPTTGESGTVYEVEMSFDATTIFDKLKMGMTGDASFVTKESTNSLAIPESFIENDNDKHYVTKIDNGVKTKTEVEVGETVDNMVIIKSGLNEGDVVYNQP